MAASIWEGSQIIGATANADNSYLTEEFEALVDGTNVFTLTTFLYQLGTGSVEVYVQGVHQRITTDFEETSTSQVTVLDLKVGDWVTIKGLVGGDGTQSAIAAAEAAAASAAAAQQAYLDTLALTPASLPLPIDQGGTGKTTAVEAYKALAVSATAVVTVDTTLTAASATYLITNMAGQGRSITLPDATTLALGPSRVVIDNRTGEYPVGIRSSGGTLIGSVAAGGIGFCNLSSNLTAAGVWTISGNFLDAGISLFNTNLSNTYDATAYTAFVALDANTSVHFAKLASGNGFAAFVVDSLGKVISSPATISITSADLPRAAFKVSATSLIVFYGVASTDNKCVVLTLTGASPSLGLSIGTPASHASDTGSAAWNSEDSIGASRVVQLSSTLYCIGYITAAGATPEVRAIGVAGAVITIGAAVAVAGAGGLPPVYITVPLTATTAALIHGRSLNSELGVVVITIVGTVCSVGVPAITGVTNAGALNISGTYALLSASKLLLGYQVTNACYLQVFTISGGNTVTAGTSLPLAPLLFSASAFAANNGGKTRYNQPLQALTANTAYVSVTSSSSVGYQTVVSESAGVLTLSSYIQNAVSAAGANGGITLPVGATEVLAHTTRETAVPYGHWLVPFKVTGGNLTIGSAGSIQLTEEFSQNVSTAAGFVKLSTGEYCLNCYYGLAVYKCTGNAVVRKGAIPLITVQTGALKQANGAKVILLNTAVANSGTAVLNVNLVEVAT